MKKVGIVTFHWAKNFGAVLQAYSLMRAVRRLGFDSYILNYCTSHDEKNNYNYFTFGSKTAYLSNFLKIILFSKFYSGYKKFSEFRRDCLCLPDDSPRWHSAEKIPDKLISETFAFITGSDQVWHPRAFDDVYGLAFASKRGKRTVAYAPSLRNIGMTEELRLKMKNDISQIDFLSAREKSVSDFVENLTGRSAPVVLDPVFLTSKEDWLKIAKLPDFNFEYMLVYVLSRNTNIEKNAKAISEKLGLPIVLLTGSDPKARGLMRAKKTLFGAGPLDFLGLFANAKFVCTNSFHGTAFSCIFQKPFAAFRNGKEDTRVSSMLQNFALIDRFVETNADFTTENPLEMDFKTSAKKIAEGNEIALKYLEKSLS